MFLLKAAPFLLAAVVTLTAVGVVLWKLVLNDVLQRRHEIKKLKIQSQIEAMRSLNAPPFDLEESTPSATRTPSKERVI